MTLYHFSNGYYETLIPQYGKNRNKGEDPRLAGKPCIWFTNKKKIVNDSTYSHCYVVEVNENNLDLIEDQTVVELTRGTSSDERWYGYLKAIEPIKIYEKNESFFEEIK